MGELIQIIAILSTIALPIAAGSILGFKKLNSVHKERMGLIQQGIIPPNEPKRKRTPNRYRSLSSGINLIALGIGILLGFLITINVKLTPMNNFWVMFASIVFFLGVGNLAFFLITKNDKDHKDLNSDSDLEEDAE